MVMILAQLHSVDWRAVGLESFGRQGDYSKRQVCGYMCREREKEREKERAREREREGERGRERERKRGREREMKERVEGNGY